VRELLGTIERFAGTFEGTGTWHDAAGKSAAYRIQQTTLATSAGFEVAFKHDFDDGTVVDARVSMTWIAPNLFRVDVSGAPVGNGYLFGDLCHYHMKVGDKFVEVSYRSGAEELAVFGSSSTNAEGNYIAWKESLRPKTT
jgi:hypothetical protein